MSSTDIYDAIVAQAAAAYGVPGAWIKAVIGAETSFQSPAPIGGAGERGPMQILLSTARGLGFSGTAAELADPVSNIAIGTAYLAEIRDRVGNDFRRVYSAYNSGNPDRWTVSSQVGANVERAVRWLDTFGGTVSAGGGDAMLLVIVAAAGVWWWRKKGAK